MWLGGRACFLATILQLQREALWASLLIKADNSYGEIRAGMAESCPGYIFTLNVA